MLSVLKPGLWVHFPEAADLDLLGLGCLQPSFIPERQQNLVLPRQPLFTDGLDSTIEGSLTLGGDICHFPRCGMGRRVTKEQDETLLKGTCWGRGLSQLPGLPASR